jgi:diguanylate cyclase (GGDEF)-like protein/PAS domain S-box-containing protein
MDDRIDPAALETVLSALLAQNPGALVAAVDGDGLFVEVPTSIDLGGHHVLRGRSALELVAGGERLTIIDAWERTKDVGAALAPVRLRDGTAAAFHFLDLRPVHGVLVAILVLHAGAEMVEELRDRTPVPPRNGRIHKNEVAEPIHVDEALCRILGYDADELLSTRVIDLVHPEDQERAIDNWMEMLGDPGGRARWRGRHRRKDGSWIWIETTNQNLLHDGEHGYVIGDMVDITDEMAALEALRQREQLLGRLAEALPLGVFHVDLERRIVYANERLHRMLGTEPATTVDEQLACVVPDDRPALDAALVAALTSGIDGDVELRVRVPGSPRLHLCSMSVRSLTDAAGAPAGAVVCLDDVTESAELRRELERRATVDELTGCLNRAAVVSFLERTLERHDTGSPGTAVVFLDLDGFKAVNDELGHRAGDELLQAVATRLRESMRDGDVVGRLGGDEFLVVVSDVADQAAATAFGERLARVLRGTVEVAGHDVDVRASLGVSWVQGPGIDADALVAAADRGMYESKRAGGGHPVTIPAS